MIHPVATVPDDARAILVDAEACRVSRVTVGDSIRFFIVALYLLLVLVFLILTRQERLGISARGLFRWVARVVSWPLRLRG